MSPRKLKRLMMAKYNQDRNRLPAFNGFLHNDQVRQLGSKQTDRDPQADPLGIRKTLHAHSLQGAMKATE